MSAKNTAEPAPANVSNSRNDNFSFWSSRSLELLFFPKDQLLEFNQPFRYLETMEGKPVSASFITDQVIEISQSDLNIHGTLFGGRLMQKIDHLAASVAKRHAGKMCMPLGIDSVRFMNTAKQGDVLICRASVNRAWPTSMEVGVNVIAEDFRTLDHKEILSAYFTFIAVDEESRPIEIIPVIPETPEQIARFEAAEKRRTVRLYCAQKS